MSNRETIRRRYRFYGTVQAVGFRWHAMKAAELYGATGWVKNKFDGSVEMEIQGTRFQIEMVVQAIERAPYVLVDRMESKDITPVDDERRFRVRSPRPSEIYLVDAFIRREVAVDEHESVFAFG